VKSAGKPRILLLMPDAGIHHLKFGSFKMSLREAPLTLTTLAALVPAELDAKLDLIDESVDKIPFDCDFDLVAISCLTGTAARAYETADRFRRAGATVVLGGVHVSLRPEEATQHADSIVTGFAERTWPMLLKDFMAGNLKSRYDSGNSDLAGMPLPRRDLQKRFAYTMPQTVFATRGCRHQCDFCTVPAVPFGWQTRPMGEVIDEISRLPGKRFAFNDVNLVSDREYAMELFAALAKLNKKWGGLAPVSIADDDELLDMAQRSGCQYLLLGFESIKQDSLCGIRKGFNRVQNYRAAMQAFHSRGIVVQGCFIFGMDGDDKNVFANTVDAVNDLHIDIPRYALYTPYPGTPAFKTLKEQGRILHECWQYYDTQHVVFQPSQMTPAELYEGFCRAYRQTFARKASFMRAWRSPHPVISVLGNAAYGLYARKLSVGTESMPADDKALSNSKSLPCECEPTRWAGSCLHAGGNKR